MSNTIKLKRGSGSDPSASDLVVGEVAVRTDSGKLFTKKDDNSVTEIGGGSGAIDDGSITNAKVASDAAIAGTKISPDFGSQTIATTGVTNLSGELRANGNVKITNPGPKISLVDSNNDDDFEIKNNDGVFTVRDATNSADRLTIASDGTVDIAGDLTLADAIVHAGDTDTKIRFSDSNEVSIETGGNERFKVTNSSLTLTGNTVKVENSSTAQLYVQGGSGSDALILITGNNGGSNGDNWQIRNDESVNKLEISNDKSGSYVDKVVIDGNGNVEVSNDVEVGGNLTITDEGGLRLSEGSSNGSNYIELKAPSSLSGNYAFTFPNSDPSNFGSGGALLKSSSSGQLSWDTSNYIATDDNIIINDSGQYLEFGRNNQIKFDSDNTNSHEITFKAPTTLTQQSDFTLPEDGSAGQFLKTDGSGVLSFASLSASATTDTTNASNISSGTLAAARIPTLNQNTTGSAATLATARTIGGASFNGSANVDISYNDLTNKPTIPTNNNQLTNGAGYITSSSDITGNAESADHIDVSGVTTNSALQVVFSTNNSGSNRTLAVDSTDSKFTYNPSSNTLSVDTVSGALSGNASTATTLETSRTIAGTSFNGSANIDISYNNLTNKPSLFSGSYNDLTSKPTIPTNNNQLSNGAGYVTSSGNTVIGTDSDINTSGATVIDQLNMTDGVIQSHSTRTITLADLGYTGATNANNITNNNQLSNGAGYLTSVSSGNINNDAVTNDKIAEYEEGTWTPSLVGGSNGASGYSIRHGSYTKMGRIVHINFGIEITGKGSMSGDLGVSSLPFSISHYIDGTTLEANGICAFWKHVAPNSSTLTLTAVQSSNVFIRHTVGPEDDPDQMQHSDIDSDFTCRGSITYFTS